VLGLLLVAAALAVVAQLGRPRITLRPQSPPRPARIAVLAFENVSGDPELELVAAGLSPAISDSVGAAGFEAIGGTFAGDDRGVASIASSLRADYVVTGSVDWREDEIHVDAYLYRSGAEPGIWAERLSWPASEKESIAGELSRRILAGFQRVKPP
jgi:TolB-like protein